MNILFVTFYFPPEVGAPQRRIWEFAVRLKERGHRVKILTGFPNYPQGKLISPYQRRLYLRENMDGIEVLRVFHFLGSRQGKLGRAVAEGSFASSASIAALLEAAPDVVIVESPSLLSGWVGTLLKRMRGSAFVLHLSDLIPDMAVALGMLSPGSLANLLHRMAHWFYREADGIVVVTEGLRSALVKKEISPDKIQFIMNGVEEDWLADGTGGHPRAANGVFRVLYFGNHGAAQNLSVILDAAGILKEEGIAFDFVGDGIEKPSLMEKASQMRLNNVFFHSSMPRVQIAERLIGADAVVVPLVGRPEMEAAVPSKLFEAMAAGKPIVLTARGESAQLVRRVDAGWVVEPDNPKALAEAIWAVCTNPEEAQKKGEKGRAFVKQHCLRSALTERLEEMLQEIAARKRKRV
ncbi:MAG: glycosyltransferase family 4 protein [candidate division Zixibacteria bacterium]|nr:glycosyltransferase family 4 protein [candidate division Zixibacteria bacterium]